MAQEKHERDGKSAGTISRKELIDLLNGDLAREYQAIIAYVIYSQTLRGAEYMAIAKELEAHAAQELGHAITIAKQIDYLGGTPTAEPKASHVVTREGNAAVHPDNEAKRSRTIDSASASAKR